ncbi:MAG: D-alanine--D-alanine ligase family protein [Chloroflexia bacterium]
MLAERGVVGCAQAVAEALELAGYRTELLPLRGDVEEALAPYPPTQWVIFNLAEGLDGRLFEEPRIAWALEAMGYRFTGSTGEALALSTHKARAKARLQEAGVPTPPARLWREVPWMLDGVSLPAIVKPVAEDASQGIGPEAVVQDLRTLQERVRYVLQRYRQAALVEQFVAGREFNLSLWGDPPELLPLAEVDFGAFEDPFRRLVSFAAKWEVESFEYRHTPVQCPAAVEEPLATRIAQVACAAWKAIGCRGYARVDIRVDAEGTPYVLEVNCNPDISPDAGFFRAARAAGYSYQEMVLRILSLAR